MPIYLLYEDKLEGSLRDFCRPYFIFKVCRAKMHAALRPAARRHLFACMQICKKKCIKRFAFWIKQILACSIPVSTVPIFLLISIPLLNLRQK